MEDFLYLEKPAMDTVLQDTDNLEAIRNRGMFSERETDWPACAQYLCMAVECCGG